MRNREIFLNSLSNLNMARGFWFIIFIVGMLIVMSDWVPFLSFLAFDSDIFRVIGVVLVVIATTVIFLDHGPRMRM